EKKTDVPPKDLHITNSELKTEIPPKDLLTPHTEIKTEIPPKEVPDMFSDIKGTYSERGNLSVVSRDAPNVLSETSPKSKSPLKTRKMPVPIMQSTTTYGN
ncbi:MAG: hypothetical protein Q4C96_05675, partial [Planctomycetia bacterium]|nr:hypothetical protein [Planctomycetia bacterium]